MSAENNRRIENLIRYGVVAEVDYAKRRAGVKSGEIVTDWLVERFSFRIHTVQTCAVASTHFETVLDLMITGYLTDLMSLPFDYPYKRKATHLAWLRCYYYF